MRVLTIISGLLLTAAGIYCFANIGKTWAAFAFILGIVLIVQGAVASISYFTERKHGGSAWLLADGLLTILLGLLALFYPLSTDLMITVIFGVWLVAGGVLRLVAAIDLKGQGSKRALLFVLAVLCIIAGIFGFVHPYLLAFALAVILGITFVVSGITQIAYGIAMGSKR